MGFQASRELGEGDMCLAVMRLLSPIRSGSPRRGVGSADLLASAMRDSQPGVGDCVPQPTYQIVKPETVLLPFPPDTEQQCRQLQEFRTCRTSESRQPLLLCSLSAISSTHTLLRKPPEFSSSSSSIDRFQPLRRESSHPTGDTLLPPADVCLFPTVKCTNVVDRSDLFPGSEHPSFKGKTRHRNYCLVLLFRSSSMQDVGSRSVSIPSAPLTCVPVHYSGMITLLRSHHGTCWWLVFCLEPYCTRMFPGRYRHGCVGLSTLVDKTFVNACHASLFCSFW